MSSSSSCDLECQNGGSCLVSDTSDNTNSNRRSISDNDDLHLLFSSVNSKTTSYCKCLDGFIGPLCQFKAQLCDSNDNICLHGSLCIENESDQNNGSNNGVQSHCDCPDTANDSTSSSTCPTQRTEFCVPQDGHVEYYGGMAVPAFCVNDGKCTDVEIDGYIYPKCICPLLYTGPHCEFLNLNYPNPPIEQDPVKGNSSLSTGVMSLAGLILLLLVFIISLLLVALFGYRQIRRRYREKRDGPTLDNIQGFRDEIDYDGDNSDNIHFIGSGNMNGNNSNNSFNIAMSPNGSMLFPAFTAPRNEPPSPKHRKRSKRQQGGLFT